MLYNNYSETNCMIIMHLGPKGGCITNILKQNPQYIAGSSHASRNAFMQKKLVITAVPLATHKLASYQEPGYEATHKYTLWPRLPDSVRVEVVSALEVRHNILSFIGSQKNTE